VELGDHETPGGAAGAAVGAEVGAHDKHLAGVVVAVAHDPLQQPAHAVGEVGERELEAPAAPGDARTRYTGTVSQASGQLDEPAEPADAGLRQTLLEAFARPQPSQHETVPPALAADSSAGQALGHEIVAHGLDRPSELLVFVCGHEAAVDQARSGGPQNVGLGAV